VAELNARETLFLELVNRTRLDPVAEASRQGLTVSAVSADARQVLAVNTLLTDSARAHSAWMNSTDTFSHSGAGGSTETQRMQAAGYVLTGSWTTAENIAWSGSSSQGTYAADIEVTLQHSGLFLSAGHRDNMLNGNFREVGVGINLGLYLTGGTNFYGMMSSFNFAKSGAASFVTGVAYNDANGDGFYSIGEGMGGVTMRLLSGGAQVASGVSQLAGAYAAATAAGGDVEAQFSGGALAGTLGVQFNKTASNAKIDATAANAVAANVSATLTQGAVKLQLLGADSLSGTGNALNNVIIGNRGHNTLDGGAGSDTLIGGSGTDTAVFALSSGSYSISYSPTQNAFILRAADGSVETAKGIERFQFADKTIDAANLQLTEGSPQPPGGSPADTIRTIISGGAFSEELNGTDSDNLMMGRGGSDTLFALGGNDVLNGGKGKDFLIGGDGDDRFDFSTVLVKKKFDAIMDFTSSDDSIRLGKTVFAALGPAFKVGEFHVGPAAHDGNDRIIYNPANGKLFYDADGMGGAKAIVFATVGVGTSLEFGDFLYL
jgi:Ca2+-binding RTX toxin-like protein